MHLLEKCFDTVLVFMYQKHAHVARSNVGTDALGRSTFGALELVYDIQTPAPARIGIPTNESRVGV